MNNFLTLCRWGGASIAAAALSVNCVFTSGCAHGSPPPQVVELPYSGPSIAVEQSGGAHVVVVHSPSAGWTVRLDRVMEGYRFQGVYVSIVQPNPAFSYLASPVEQRLATNVLEIEPVKVFAREVNFKGESPTGDAYAFTAQSAAITADKSMPAKGASPASGK